MPRPTQLSRPILALLIGSAGLSFASGVLLWWAQSRQLSSIDLAAAPSVEPWLTIHGALNPLLCVLFGYLLCQHVKGGWNLKRFRPTGLCALTVFGALIMSGAALYYAGQAGPRELLVWFHRVAGLLFPLLLGWHGAASFRSAKSAEQGPKSAN